MRQSQITADIMTVIASHASHDCRPLAYRERSQPHFVTSRESTMAYAMFVVGDTCYIELKSPGWSNSYDVIY